MLKSIVLILTFASLAQAAIKTEKVVYKDGAVELEGFIAYDDAKKGPLPAVIIAHDWMGPSEYTEMRAKQLAQLGYYAFAADIYGTKVRPRNAKEASKVARGFLKDRKLLQERGRVAYEYVKKQKKVNPHKISAMGYCFGGAAVLEMARQGLPLKGVLTFHGDLSNPTPQNTKDIKAKLLIMHGALDPYVKMDEVMTFKKELDEAKIDYELIIYSGAVHAFTRASVGNDVSKGAAYNAEADRRSFQSMENFLAEVNE